VYKPERYIAFFDIDHTILNVNSGSALISEAFKSGMMSYSDLIRAYYYSVLYRLKLKDPAIIITRMARWMKGVRHEEFKRLAEQVVDKHLKLVIRPDILNEIDYHRRNNAEIVILSSVLKEICIQLGAHLGMDNTICTTMEVVDGVYTGLPVTKFCFRDEKRIQLKDYCEKHYYNLSAAYYYGDSIEDLPALEIVGNPVCIAPDRKLRQIAVSRNWRICEW